MIGWMKQILLYISLDVTCCFDDVMLCAYAMLRYITKFNSILMNFITQSDYTMYILAWFCLKASIALVFYSYNIDYTSATKLDSYSIMYIFLELLDQNILLQDDMLVCLFLLQPLCTDHYLKLARGQPVLCPWCWHCDVHTPAIQYVVCNTGEYILTNTPYHF